MRDEPDIIKELREAEKLGVLQSKVQSAYEELETPKEASDDVPDETVSFDQDDDAEKKETVCDGAAYEQTVNESPDSEIYRTIFENVSDEIIYVDKHGKIVNVNRRSYDIFGYKPEEMIGKNFSRLGWLGVRDLPKMLKLFKDAIGGKTIDLLELEVKHRDGHIVPVEVSTRPVKKNGKTVGFLSIVRDITERKNAEMMLIEREKEFRFITESSLDTIFTLTKTGKITYISPSSKELFGFEPNEMIGTSFSKYVTKGELPIYLKSLKNVILHRKVPGFETYVKHSNGSLIPVEINGQTIERNGKLVAQGTIRDITERKKAEKEINYLEEYNENILESNPNSIIVTKGDQIEYVNKSFISIFGKNRKDYISKELKEVLPAFEKLLQDQNKMKELEVNGKSFSVSSFVVKKAEEEEEEEEERIGIVLQDITDRKQAEEVLCKNEEKWRSILGTAPNIIMTLDHDGTIQFINRTVAGLTPDQVIGKNQYDFIQPEYVAVVKGTIEQVFQTGNMDKYQIQGTGPDGSISWYETHVGPIKQNGKVVAVTLSIIDITERKQVEKDLQERVKELKCLYGVASITERPGITLDELYLEVANLLPFGLQYPESVCARLIIDNMKFETENFRETEWKQSADIKAYGAIAGIVEVFYLEEKPDSDEGPFLKDERLLIEAIAERLGRITERMQAGEKLKENEEKLRSIVETTSDWIWEVDKNGIYKYVSPKVKDLLGYSPEEVIGKTPFDLMPKDEAERVSSAFLDCIKSNKPIIGLENTNLHKDGRRVILETSGVPFFDGSGNLLGYRGIDRDVTERKKADDALCESEERLRTVLEAVKDGITFSDEAGHFEVFNSEMEKLTGYSMKEANASPDFNRLIYPDPEKCRQALDGLNKLSKPGDIYKTETTFHTKKGIDRDVLISTTVVLHKGRKMFLSAYHDITERKQAGEKLKENEQRLKTILDNLQAGVAIIDAETHEIIDVNPMAIKMVGTSKENIVGKICNKFICPAEKGKCPITDLGQKIDNSERILINAKGDEVPVFKTVVPLTINGRQCLIDSFVDMTNLKQTQEALQESTKRYHELIEGSHDGYLMTDMDDKIIEYNNVFKKITGYTNGELHEKTHKGITPQEWHPIEAKIVKEQVLKNGYSEVYEKELIGKDGRIIPVEFRRYLLKEKGKPATTWSFVRDITERKQTKDELLEKINALERYKNITVGRELKIIELKKKVKKLEQKLEIRKG